MPPVSTHEIHTPPPVLSIGVGRLAEPGQTRTAPRLPFRVRPAKGSTDFAKVDAIRKAAYRKHFRGGGSTVEPLDAAHNTTVVIAESFSSDVLGTARFADGASGPIELDRFVTGCEHLDPESRNCAEITRLAVLRSPHADQVKAALWKAYHRYCLTMQIEWMVMSVKRAAVPVYKAMGFTSLGPQGRYRHTELGDREHESFACSVNAVEDFWRRTSHPLYDFIFTQRHPEIRWQ